MKFARKLVLSSVILVLFAGCKTAPVRTILPPPAPVEEQASFDENEQNSGIKDYIEGKGFLITKNAKERYEALAAIYGLNMVPTFSSNSGLSPALGGDYYLSAEGMSNFIVWSEKKKSGR